ncbi:MAG: hypothetical protein IPK26_31020 [Planctomycetes bacterium]|nr:hypothetical protein [Planctomycetota bacterium]
MTFAEPVTLTTLMLAAAGVGVAHTLAGPDHYLPLLASARANAWSARKAMWLTAIAGLLHCLASAALVPFAWWLTDGVARLAGVQQLRGDAMAWFCIGVGLALCMLAWRQSRRGEAAIRGLRGWLLVAFALGPCEWLIPNALAAVDGHGIVGSLLVIAVFSLATTTTMLVAVAAGLRLLPATLANWRIAPFLPGATLAMCGLLVLAGL